MVPGARVRGVAELTREGAAEGRALLRTLGLSTEVRMRVLVALALGLTLVLGASSAAGQNRITPDAPRPIAAGESLWAEELTFMEVREAVRSGTTTIIIGTGGVEQNGPYVAGGKHNFVLQTVLPYIAREIGHALIAPIVKFVPEGDIEPTPTGHMQYAGTISLEPATFEALLTDICRSYKAHGFTDIILLGDSGGNQAGMEHVADGAQPEVGGREGARPLPARVLLRGPVELRLPEEPGHHADRQDAAARAAARPPRRLAQRHP